MLVHEGHLIVPWEHKQLVLDTGSPISYPKNVWGLSASQLSDHVGCQVDGLLGMDVLGDKRLNLNIKDEEFSVCSGSLDELQGMALKIETDKIVPTIEATLMCGTEVTLAIDTGAPVGYLSSGLHSAGEYAGQAEDFFPMFGPFTTDIHEQCIELDGRSYVLDFGQLPGLLESVLDLWGVDGILGYQFLRDAGNLTFDFPNKELVIL